MSIVLQGSTSGSITLQEPAIAGTTVLDLPASSGNVVVDSATQTLTNKTIQGGQWTSPSGSTITSGTAVASTSGTSIDFTSIPSWVKRVTVMFRGVSVSGTSSILIQLGDSGGIETTGYVSSSTGFSGGAGATSSSTAGLIVFTNDATYINSGIITITNITSNVWINGGAGKISTGVSWTCGGDKELSATLDRIRITTVNGTDTFDAGTINILYE